MKIQPIKQKDSSACGPASLKMAVSYFNLPISLNKINNLSQYHKKGGLYNKDLVKTLRKLGLKNKVINNASWSDLIKYNKPENVIIVSWMLRGYIGHFSVVDKVTTKDIYLAEPESGKIIKLDKLVFLRLWFDFDPKWYPQKNTDIHLRWMVVVSKN
ncbi:C39 family peptidase [Patescibacteria group bacterium]|nr:C39 family peptidase [Patescibacteria group bacterium]